MIDAYRKLIDLTLLRENLRRTPEERLLQLESLHDFAAEVRRAGDELIVAKRAAGRPKDFEVIAKLEAIRGERT